MLWTVDSLSVYIPMKREKRTSLISKKSEKV